MGDVGCFVTSAEWLDANYGSIIRELLVDGLGGRALHVLDPTAVAFEDAMTTTAIACFEVGASPSTIRLRRVSTPSELGDLRRGKRTRAEQLASAKRWSPLLKTRRRTKPPRQTVALGDIARVHRGIATGSNKFFVLTRDMAQGLGIDGWCRPVIASAKEILTANGVIFDDRKRKLLVDFPNDIDRENDETLDRYLAHGEKSGVCERYIPSHHRPWWRLGVGTAPPIVATYMARQPPVFALNPDGLVLLNIAHGIYPREPMSQETLNALVAALNAARESYRGAGRTYHGGLEKFEPGEMEQLRIPLLT